MGKYQDLNASLVRNVGGVENISSVTHCATRLRFKLKDESKANDEAIEATKGVITLRKTMGQYQVVIGQQVGDVYDELVDEYDLGSLAAGSVDDPDATAEDTGEQKLGVGGRILDILTSAMGPLLAVVCAGGIIKGLCSILTLTGLMTADNTLYMLFDAAGDCMYYFLPVLVGFSLSKKLKMNPVIGLTLGLVMVYPTVQNMQSATLFGIDISNITYAKTMFPMIFAMLVAAPIDHFLKRILPDAISSFMEPAILLLIMTPLAYAIIGPIANLLANLLAAGIEFISGVSPVLCGIVLGATWQIMVLFGIHMGVASVVIPTMLAVGTSTLYPVINVCFASQLGIAVALLIRSKDGKIREIALPAAISACFGTTEPAIYGLSLPNFKYFVASCVSAGIAGAYLGLTNVTAYQLAGSGFLCLPSCLTPAGLGDLVNMSIGIVICFAITFAFTLVTWRDKGTAKAVVK